MYYIYNQAGEIVSAVATSKEADLLIASNSWYAYYRYIG